jgi:hypothetical protein
MPTRVTTVARTNLDAPVWNRDDEGPAREAR